ncbi:hypothetical protein L0665_03915 [Methanogenium marinum]|uniref:Uncharacterized protein n=1 Tax=Methanogenium marinum TaxID=348610 RepID=A0A9Q4KNN3_9EURY|nr:MULTISPECIES: hypothetical protein [Methanogenium]MDE4907758.1 hypothetical protein [Methanogenium marinum]WFN33461.1 hypothetical protein L1S32_06260 [Methanogenium sp. S4BF]
MSKDDFFRKELVTELRRIEVAMRKEESVEKKIYYFSAAYGITSRTFRYSFTEDYLMADCILNTAYNGIMDRFKRVRSGDSTVKLEPVHFERIQDGLRMLADAFESETSILVPLEQILTTMYSLTGPGNYLREKGLLNF